MFFLFVGVKSKAYCIKADSFSEVSGTFSSMKSVLGSFFLTNPNHRLQTLPPKKIPVVLFKQFEKCLILRNDIPKAARGDCEKADTKP